MSRIVGHSFAPRSAGRGSSELVFGQAEKARRFGIPVVDVQDFLRARPGFEIPARVAGFEPKPLAGRNRGLSALRLAQGERRDLRSDQGRPK